MIKNMDMSENNRNISKLQKKNHKEIMTKIVKQK